MSNHAPELAALGQYLSQRRTALLQAWADIIKADPTLTTSNALPRAQLNDHIPAVLASFERELGHVEVGTPTVDEGVKHAAAHGLHRWQQGYDLREVTRELGRLNECMVVELERYALANLHLDPHVMITARQRWARACSGEIEASTSQYFRLHQVEASGHVKDLERALEELREVEQQRAELWQQVAHDLRGNVGVVTSATSGLTQPGIPDPLRERFLKMLERNVGSLRHLLDDVTILARLEAGREARVLAPVDVGAMLAELCEALLPMAQQRGLTLKSEGPLSLHIEADAVKVRRIAQNLILNAIRYTKQGGVTVTWGDSIKGDDQRWSLAIQDTGPGFTGGPGAPIASAIAKATELPAQAPLATAGLPTSTTLPPIETRPVPVATGEGIGLSIVKRLTELLDAAVELESVPDVGTTFRILIPRKY